MTPSPSATDTKDIAVCLVDDDEIMQDLVSRHIKRLGIQVTVADEPEAALDIIATATLDVVISDLYMPNMEDGLKFVADVKQRHPELPVVVMSSEMSQSTQNTLLTAGAFACLKKPVNAKDIASVLNEATTRNRAA